MIRSFDQVDSVTLARFRSNPAAFIEECLISPYDGQPYQLNNAERRFIEFMFQFDDDGRMLFPLLLYSAIKKSRKTEFSALLTLTTILLFGGRYAEGWILANDQEQAQSRCFTACRRIVETSPLLRHEAKITAERISFPATQSTITAVASDYASIAGGHPVISTFSEFWAYASERLSRLWDECIPVPTKKVSCRLVETHAGFEGEGHLLQNLYKRGLRLPEVGTDLRAGDGMLMFWSHTPICHWQDEKWLAQMRRDLPANQYLRMAENRFTSTEAAFIDMAKWDDCVDLGLGHTPGNPTLPIWVGVDASTKHDSTAVVAVTWNKKSQQARLVTHRIFQPSPDQPLNFEATIERTVLDLSKRFQLRQVLFDPYQMQATAQRLTAAGIKIEEFPQSSPNLTTASQNLYDLIMSGSLRCYPDAAMRVALSRCVAVETPRGWRIAKEKVSHKIDVIVALAMAAYAAVQGASTSGYDRTWSGWQDDAGGKEGVDRNTEAFKDQLLGFCNGMINGGGGGGRWR